ncbi:AAA family ATPase [Halomonas sp. ML-15]|uniref:AAA family ATPase n=1 Tax=Halomonas sp. ML-15 TaxID=2773305 RepID=UPI0017462484|nr:AAA family ATPase [Halomonas sp. ML-15]MBD3896100.1 AAA family ATPase [Halomonas sp. ML-15]
MKILALRLANLASLPGPLELDFTAAPLRDAGLFAITGPTGAGKSTLLDALCLALYGSTPRLRQAPVRDAPLPDVEGETLNTADPRTLLRRGTAGGYAEVDFLGRDGRRYRARWAVRRAREKASGRLQAAEQSLRDLDDDRLLTTQKREFDRLLPERLGLSFDQFTRAVLLAQSEFAAFLKADDNERSDLLERLTGTAEYSQISIAAYRRATQAKKAVDALDAKLADDLPAEPEARAELERAAEATQQALTHLKSQQESLSTRQRWHDDDARLHDAYHQGLAERQVADEAWQALTQQRADRDFRQLIAPRRHALARQSALPGEIAALEATHAKTQAALEDAHHEQQAAATQLTQAEQALTAANDARHQADPALRDAREQAQRLATLEKQLADLAAQRQQQQTQASALAEQHRQAEAAQQSRQQQRDDWQAALTRLVGTHSRLDDARQAAQQAHDSAAQRHLALGELGSRWQEFGRVEAAHRRLSALHAKHQASRETLLADGQAARQRLDRADAHLASVTALIERSRAVRSESVAQLRESLQPGEPCPVCGGLDHPWRQQPPATPEAAQLAAQEAEEARQLDDAKQARDDAQQQRDTLVGEYRAVEAALVQGHKELEETERRLTSARSALQAHPLYSELEEVNEAQRDAWLRAQQDDSEARRRRERQTLDELTRAEAEIAPLEEALRQGELTLTRLAADKAGADRRLAELDAQLPPLQAQRDTLSQRLAEILGEHASADAWQQHLDAALESARQARERALAKQHEAEQTRLRLTQQREYEAEQLSARRQEQQTLERELSAWRSDHPELDDATLARLLAQGEDEARTQEQRIEAADQARQRAAATLAERRSALLEHRRGQSLADSDADEALLGEGAQREIARQLQALIEARHALAPQLDAAQQQRDEAAHALRDDDRKRQRQQQGQAERESARAEYRRWGQISELIGSADGKLFRRIAQAYNLEQLLEHANLHLAGLSRRYRLVRGGSELGLLVVDNDMADERRSVHSLSGGETFLVSLALALGLASMASGELTIESLFIDEGFGSLDPQSLALAMEALDGLQALGRRVGVISHVQEMHERIPVQIQVEPLGNGTSRARLVSA